jgi:hypothetical protein
MTRVPSVQSLTRSTYLPQRGHVQVLVHLPDRRKRATLKRPSICWIRSRDVHRAGRALPSLAIDSAAVRMPLLSILPLLLEADGIIVRLPLHPGRRRRVSRQHNDS